MCLFSRLMSQWGKDLMALAQFATFRLCQTRSSTSHMQPSKSTAAPLPPTSCIGSVLMLLWRVIAGMDGWRQRWCDNRFINCSIIIILMHICNQFVMAMNIITFIQKMHSHSSIITFTMQVARLANGLKLYNLYCEDLNFGQIFV